MNALSIMQPWASLIAFGHKLIENRTWQPPRAMIGVPFAIHASKKIDMDALTELHHGMCGWKRENWPYAQPKLFPTSAIIAVATIDRVIVGDGDFEPDHEEAEQREPWCLIPRDQRRWYFGPVGFLLRDVRRIEPPIANVKGALGFWRINDTTTPRLGDGDGEGGV